MAYGYILEAEYKDGFIHRETEEDKSLYEEGKNVFYDILHHLPEPEHGPLVRFEIIPEQPGEGAMIDWTELPDNARPIYYREMQLKFNVDGSMVDEPTVLRHVFGYQYNDEEGKNHKIIKELPNGPLSDI